MIKKFIGRNKKVFITCIVALCFVMMVGAGINRINPRFFGNILGYAVVPAERAAEGTRRWSGGIGEYFANLRSLSAENERLKKENEYLEAEFKRLIMVEIENRDMAEILKMAEEYNQYSTMGAEIINKDPGNWFNAYHVNKGSKHGVTENMWVVHGRALAGRVTEVNVTYSKIVSLIDDTSRIAAQTIRPHDPDHERAMGYVMGDTILMMEGFCKMERIREDADVQKGDIVVTGHHSTVYPANIPIGEIVDVLSEPDGTRRAIVKPYVDFSDMRAVVIVTDLFDNEFARDGE
jgi:rod shape-determining protein MreC